MAKAPASSTPFDEQPVTEPPKKQRKTPVTQLEVFDEEARIVRLFLRRCAALPNEQSRLRTLNRVYELREFPLVDEQKE